MKTMKIKGSNYREEPELPEEKWGDDFGCGGCDLLGDMGCKSTHIPRRSREAFGDTCSKRNVIYKVVP